AELDEGNVWEAVAEEALNVLLIVDLNRQSLDRVIPGIRAAQTKALFHAAGWHVLAAKYGRDLQAVFARPGGAALRRRIDEMSNDEYQSLLRRPGADVRLRLARPQGLDGPEDGEIAAALLETPDEALPSLLGNLGGHDLNELLRVFALAGCVHDAPVVIFAYTIKGWGLPFAGDALNHSMMLNAEQSMALQGQLGIAEGAEWDAFPAGSPEQQCCRAAAARLRRVDERPATLIQPAAIPPGLDLTYPGAMSTQE